MNGQTENLPGPFCPFKIKKPRRIKDERKEKGKTIY